jgi:hypothetical protein
MNNIYIISNKYGIECFSNLSKLIRKYHYLGYYQVYYRLKEKGSLQIKDNLIIKTVVK